MLYRVKLLLEELKMLFTVYSHREVIPRPLNSGRCSIISSRFRSRQAWQAVIRGHPRTADPGDLFDGRFIEEISALL